MISQDTFVGLLHDLGDVDAPSVDGRLGAIQHKITIVRIRRAVTAAVAVVAIVAAGMVVAALRSAPAPVPTQRPTQTPIPALTGMPESWTATDGVEYRLVTVVTMDTARQNSMRVTVPAGTPITLRYRCDGGTATVNGMSSSVVAQITVGAGQFAHGFDPNDRELRCDSDIALADFDTAKLARTGNNADLFIKGVPNGASGTQRVYPARWTIGIYSWSTVTAQRTPEFLPGPPKMPGYRLATFHPIPWPRTWITFEIPAHTTWGTLMTCTDAFAGAKSNPLQLGFDNSVQMSIDGKPADGVFEFDCPVRIAPGTLPIDNAPAGKARTVTLKVTIDPIYHQRLGEVLIGIYYKN